MVQSLIKDFLQDLGAGAAKLNHELYIVGGYTRNKLYTELNNKSFNQNQDIDLVINTDAIDFIHKFQKYYEDNHPEHLTFDILEEFEAFATIKINDPENSNIIIEIASTRTESYEEPAAFPEVSIISDIQDDLPRRDFTINAILESLHPKSFGEIIDYVGGIDDLKNKLIRAFHKNSFIDDPTRIVRAARFLGEYDFQIEQETLTNIKLALNNPEFSSWQKKRKNRFAIEFEKINALTKEQSSRALRFLGSIGLT